MQRQEDEGGRKPGGGWCSLKSGVMDEPWPSSTHLIGSVNLIGGPGSVLDVVLLHLGTDFGAGSDVARRLEGVKKKRKEKRKKKRSQVGGL